MTNDDLNEAVGVLQTAIKVLQAAVPSAVGRQGAEFRYACGDILASAASLISTAALGAPLQACFDLATDAGATQPGVDAVRLAMTAASPSGQTAIWVAGGCYCYALGAEVKILTGTTFVSSNDVFIALASFGAAIGTGQDWAADNHMSDLYQALITLGAATTRDLTTRAAPLPRLTTYSLPRGTTSHALAYRLYGDANRADELRAENGVIHPSFMPASGSALSE